VCRAACRRAPLHPPLADRRDKEAERSERRPDQTVSGGALTDLGIDDHFMKQLTATLTPGSSTLSVLVRTRVFSIHPCHKEGAPLLIANSRLLID
jgi:hypothetical protein